MAVKDEVSVGCPENASREVQRPFLLLLRSGRYKQAPASAPVADDLLTPVEAASLLRVAESTIDVLVHRGNLPAARWPVQLLRSDVLAFVDDSRIKPREMRYG